MFRHRSCGAWIAACLAIASGIACAESALGSVVLSDGRLLNRSDVPQVMMIEQAGRWRTLKLMPEESRKVGDGRVSLQKLAPVVLGLQQDLGGACTAMSVVENARLFRPLKAEAGQIAAQVEDASSLIDQGRIGADEVAHEAYLLRKDDPDLAHQLGQLDARIDYKGDLRVAEILDDEGSSEEWDRLNTEKRALMKRRQQIADDAMRRNVMAKLGETSGNSSEATAVKEKVFAQQASKLDLYEADFGELLKSYNVQLDLFEKEFEAEENYQETLVDAMREGGLLFEPVKGFSARMECGNSPFSDRLIVSVDEARKIAPRYLQGSVEFDSGESLDLLLVPVAGKTNVFVADFLWPVEGKQAVLAIGETSARLSRTMSFEALVEDLRSDLAAVRSAAKKAKHNSKGGLVTDSAGFGF